MSINKQIEALGFTGWGFGNGDGSLWFMRSEDKKVEIVKSRLGDIHHNYFVKDMIHLVLFDDRVEFTQNFTQILRTCTLMTNAADVLASVCLVFRLQAWAVA